MLLRILATGMGCLYPLLGLRALAAETGTVQAPELEVPGRTSLPSSSPPFSPLAQQSEAIPAEPLAPAAGKTKESPWAGSLELYGFAPLRVTNTTTINGFSATTDMGLGSLLEHLTDIFYLRGSVEYKRIGFLTDLSYVGLGAEHARRFDSTRALLPELDRPRARRSASVGLSAIQGIDDFALRYRFGERERPISHTGAMTLIPYAGVRLLNLGLDINTSFEGPLVQISRKFSFGHPIVQPLLGLQGQIFLSPRLRLFARGDLGGFGANYDVDMSGNAQVGVGYAIGNSAQLNLSWRYLYLAGDNGASRPSGYIIDQNGIELGVKFFF